MMMKKSKIRYRVLTAIGIVCIGAACLLAAYNVREDYRASSAAEEMAEAVKEKTQAAQKQADSKEALPGGELPDYVKDPNMEMPVVEIDGYPCIGTLAILPLEIELPVMDDWSYPRMKVAPCRYKGSAYLDDLVICGHNYRSHFGRLNKLQKEDEIVFTDAAGNVFHYRVEEIDELSATAIDEMTSGSWDLTLFTCTVGGRARVTVRCSRVK